MGEEAGMQAKQVWHAVKYLVFAAGYVLVVVCGVLVIVDVVRIALGDIG